MWLASGFIIIKWSSGFDRDDGRAQHQTLDSGALERSFFDIQFDI